MANGTIGVSQIDVLTTSGTGTLSIVPPATNTNRTLTLPDATTTIVGTDATQTLTNKTLGSGLVMGASATTLETAKAYNWNGLTNNTSLEFTGLPSWIKRITVMLQGVSTNANNNLIIQLGISGGYTTSGYLSSLGSISSGVAGNANATNGFIISSSNSSSVISGIVTISNLTGNTWVYSGTTKSTTVLITYSAGDISLAGALTQIKVQDTAGTGQFDAGTINIMYE